MSDWRRTVATAIAAAMVLVAVRIVYVGHQETGGTSQSGSPTLTRSLTGLASAALPSPLANLGPTPLYAPSIDMLVTWENRDPGENMTFRAIQGLVNRAYPSIFLLQQRGPVHDQDWLNILATKYGANVITTADSTNQINDLTWYMQKFKPYFAGYLLFDLSGGGASANVALSVAGALNAIPIERGDTTLIQAAQSDGLTQLDDVSGRDYAWLKASSYWSMFSRDAIFFSSPSGLSSGGDLAVAQRAAVFWDDVRLDPQMLTMSAMLTDQNAGGIVYGWGYTDAQYHEDIFVSVASRYSQSLMDTPANLSVYMHYPQQTALSQSAPPALPTDLHKHYVAFVYSDGDNPRVILDELTLPGNDRYASPLRGKFPIGWTLPPTLPSLAGPVVNNIFATATPNDQFLAGPSGYGFMFPSLFPQEGLFAAQTQQGMTQMDLANVVVMDTSGSAGFTNQALDPLTAQSQVQGGFFVPFNGPGQPPTGTILWSNGKPVVATYLLQRTAGQRIRRNSNPISNAIAELNGLPTDGTLASGYTIVYVDFWSISMYDIQQVISGLGSNVVVVRPDVLAAMTAAYVTH